MKLRTWALASFLLSAVAQAATHVEPSDLDPTIEVDGMSYRIQLNGPALLTAGDTASYAFRCKDLLGRIIPCTDSIIVQIYSAPLRTNPFEARWLEANFGQNEGYKIYGQPPVSGTASLLLSVPAAEVLQICLRFFDQSQEACIPVRVKAAPANETVPPVPPVEASIELQTYLYDTAGFQPGTEVVLKTRVRNLTDKPLGPVKLRLNLEGVALLRDERDPLPTAECDHCFELETLEAGSEVDLLLHAAVLAPVGEVMKLETVALAPDGTQVSGQAEEQVQPWNTRLGCNSVGAEVGAWLPWAGLLFVARRWGRQHRAANGWR